MALGRRITNALLPLGSSETRPSKEAADIIFYSSYFKKTALIERAANELQDSMVQRRVRRVENIAGISKIIGGSLLFVGFSLAASSDTAFSFELILGGNKTDAPDCEDEYLGDAILYPTEAEEAAEGQGLCVIDDQTYLITQPSQD